MTQALEDVVALWPEVPWPVANVVCEGPSVVDFNPYDLLLGPTIAVNHALAIPSVRADFWATSDNPMNLWEWSKPYRTDQLRYFTTDQNLGVFSELLGPYAIRRVYSREMTDMGIDTEEGNPVILPTIITTLGWLVWLGVKRVRIFGADMLGAGSPLTEGYEPEESRNWYSRWVIERILLAHTMRLYRAQGARIERWPTKKSPRKHLALV